MTAHEMILLHEAHFALANLPPGSLSRLAAYRVTLNMSKLDPALALHREAFRQAVAAEKEKDDRGDLDHAALENEVWQELGQEEVAVLGLRSLPARDLPWEQMDPKASFNLVRLGLIEGDLDAQAIAS
jgi:hypothetical protein